MVRAILANTLVWAIDRRGRLCCSDAKTRQWAYLDDPPQKPTVLAYWKEHNRVIVGCADGSVHVYDGTERVKFNEAHATSETSISALCVLEEENALFVGTSLGNLVRLELATLDLFAELDQEKGHNAPITSIVKVDNWLFSGGADALIYVWDFADNSCHSIIRMSEQPITCLFFFDRYLWMGLQDGTVQVLDVFGEDGCEIGIVNKVQIHKGAVRCFLQVGERELWSAPIDNTEYHIFGGPSHGRTRGDGDDDDDDDESSQDAIAVWDLETCQVKSKSLPLPEDGLLGILIRQRFVHEELKVSVFDTKLMPFDINVKTPATCQPIWTPPNYSSVLEVVTQSELNRLKDRYRQMRENCTCHYSQTLNGFNNGNPANIDPESGITSNEISVDMDVDTARNTEPNSKRHPTERAYTSLIQSLHTARKNLLTVLDESKLNSSEYNRNGRRDRVDVGGVVSASENIQAAIGLASQVDPTKIMNADILNLGFDAVTPTNNSDGYLSYTKKPKNRPISLQDFNAIMLQRDDLASELELLKHDTNTTIDGMEELIEQYKQRVTRLEESLEKATIDDQEFESSKRRVVELEVLLKRSIEDMSQKVKTMEPMLTDHITQAYDHMAGDREQLQMLRDAKADLESKLGISNIRISDFERETADQREYINKLTMDLDAATREVEELKDEQDSMEKSISELRVACTLHDKELEFTRSANSKLREAMEDIQSELELTKGNLRRTQESETESRKEVRRLEVEEKSLKTQLKLAVEEGRSRERSILDGQSAVDDMGAKLEKAEKTLNSTRREVAKLTRVSDSVNEENKSLKRQLTETRTSLFEKLQQLRSLEEEKKALLMDRNTLEIQLDDMPDSVCTSSDDQNDQSVARESSASSPRKVKKRPQHSMVRATEWEVKGSRDDKELREALEAAAESTRCTQEVVKELASTAKAYKRAAAYHAQSQTAIYAILKRMRQLKKRKTVTGAHITPIIEALLKVMYIDDSTDGVERRPNSVASSSSPPLKT